MNKDTLQGEWKQLKGKIKEKWGKLTDDEIEQIHGHKEQLLGKLQSKYGMNKEKAEEQLKEFEHKCNADCFQGHWNQIKGKLKEKWGNLTDDEISQINGKREQLLGKIQTKYGIPKEKAELQLQEFMENYNRKETASSGSSRSSKH